MRTKLLLLILFFLGNTVAAQSEFSIGRNKNKVVIPFKLINNLIFIPLELNGERLTFLLDTGVEETILFSLDENEEVKINDVKIIQLQGLGDKKSVEGYKSSNNTLAIKTFKDIKHEIYIVLDQEFNFSSLIGIPVNGIIGYHFFKNHLVEIDYTRKKIILYNTEKKPKYRERLQRNYQRDTISIEFSKPYVQSSIYYKEQVVKSKLLIDTGNSDGIWIFKLDFQLSEKVIDDYLGRGFSGGVYGKRGRIPGVLFGNHFFDKPIATFPDSTSLKNVKMVEDRVGSIGGELLSRFNVVLDYPNSLIYTKPNSRIEAPINYNMSGIQLEHAGLEWVDTSYDKNYTGVTITFDKKEYDANNSNNFIQVRFKLKPVFKIAAIRSNSEAEKAGLKVGDRLIRIAGKTAYELTISKINEILRSEEGKTIKIEYERDGKKHKISFQLKKII